MGIIRYFHKKALAKSIDQLEAQVRAAPNLDYAGPMRDTLAEAVKLFPKGLAQTPCAATRAFCVDLNRLAVKADHHGLTNVSVALTAFNIYFSAWNISYHDPKDTQALTIKNRARAIIDRFVKGEAAQPAKDDWYASYEDWYMMFRMMASAESTDLHIDRSGNSPIDFMDQAPLRRAYADKIDPMALGADFGKNFDPDKFGK